MKQTEGFPDKNRDNFKKSTIDRWQLSRSHKKSIDKNVKQKSLELAIQDIFFLGQHFRRELDFLFLWGWFYNEEYLYTEYYKMLLNGLYNSAEVLCI